MLYRIGRFELDAGLYALSREGEAVEAEPRVVDLLLYLIEQRHRVVSKSELLGQLWPEAIVGESALVRVISLARSALDDSGTRQDVIRTVARRGYRFIASVEPLASPDETDETFVGRKREVALLQGALDAALAGRGGATVVAGEPGVGKTRLAEHVAARARGRGARVLWGSGYEAEGRPAFWPWTQVLRSWVAEHAASDLEARLGASASVLAEIVPDIREQLPELPDPPRSSPAQARFRLFDGVARLLVRESTERPIVLVLDDLHQVDEPSLRLLEFVAQQISGTRLLVIGTFRDADLTHDHPLATALAELARTRPPAVRVELSGLSREDVVPFVERVIGLEATAERIDRVWERTEGNPLFMREWLTLCAQRDPSWTGASPEIPPGVRPVIEHRLSVLSPACRELLATASVLGREFALPALSALVEAPADQVLERLDPAVAARVLEQPPEAAGPYRFSHALVRDTLYEGLGGAARVRLHRRAGRALESLYAARPVAPTNLDIPIDGAHAAELAHHFHAAAAAGERDDADRAVDYAVRAGDHALESLAFEAATSHYARALELLSDEDPRQRLERARVTGRLGAAREALLARSNLSES